MKAGTLIMLTGILLLYACKNKSYEALSNSSADTVSTDSATDLQAMLVRTAEMRLKVNDVCKTHMLISSLVTNSGGMVLHSESSSTAGRSSDARLGNDSVMRTTAFNVTAGMIVKIPNGKVEKFLDSVARMGIYVNMRTMDVTDKSFDYLSARLKLNNRNELVNRQKKGTIVIKNPADVLQLKDEQVDEQISNKEIDEAVKNSTVNLNFYQNETIITEIVANDDPSAHHPPFFRRLTAALAGGWETCKNLLLMLAYSWCFIFTGTCAWQLLRYLKARKLTSGGLPAFLTKK